nr:polyprotein [Clover yellow vein virus]
MAQIMIGSIVVPLQKDADVPKFNINITNTTPQAKPSTLTEAGPKNMSFNSDCTTDPFRALTIACKERVSKFGDMVFKTRRGITTLVPKPAHLVEKEKRAAEALKRFMEVEWTLEKIDPDAEYHVPDYRNKGSQVSFKSPHYKRTPKMAKKLSVTKVVKGKSKIQHVTNALLKIAKTNNLILEVVDDGKRVNHATFTKYGSTYGMHIVVNHMVRKRRSVDVQLNDLMASIAQQEAIEFNSLNVSTLKEGHSGLVLRTETVPNCHFNNDDITIVRGVIKSHGVSCLIDARQSLNSQQLGRIREFSAGDLFWKGYNQTFIDNRPKDIGHSCTSDLNVVQCGSVMALMTLALFPCGRITCKECVEDFHNQNNRERYARTEKFLDQAMVLLSQSYPEFKHSRDILQLFRERLSMENANADACVETNKAITSLTETPFNHIRKINEVFIKYGSLTNDEVGLASTSLLEVARYIRNRTDSIQRNDLSKFRNKISSKTHINLDLMCDNQLDKNANFMWGQRAYHAKRFLSNYFSVIDPSEGYDKFVKRKLPNGTRELATGRLIVPTNFESFRDQMKGTMVDNRPIGKECVSRVKGAFCYPCCCTTDDVGNAILSEFKMPTKYHLVLGGQEAAKYIELPSDSSGMMYIAKDGYCHINIFFAMLVNVSEDKSKDFTKMVRDQIMPKLGQWPTMLDVATACWYLTVWYPDTLSAELPRILVDHKLSTMHVLDSYGSISTGYHVLKANIVSQLIKFASDDLESDLKFYRVGGMSLTGQVIQFDTKMLISSIYRPKQMEKIINEEPFILVLAMQSPSVLLALFNSASLEKAVNVWLHQDMRVSHVMTMLALLAAKVSAAKMVNLQMEIIESSASHFLAAMDTIHKPMHSINTANIFLMNLEEGRSTDRTIDELGFHSLKKSSQVLMEKIWAEDLEQQWLGLRLSQKFYLIKQSWKQRVKYSKILAQRDELGVSDKFSASLRLSAKSIKNQAVSCKKRMVVVCKRGIVSAQKMIAMHALRVFKRCMGNFVDVLNVLATITLLMGVLSQVRSHIQTVTTYKRVSKEARVQDDLHRINEYYELLRARDRYTVDEFRAKLESLNPELLETFDEYYKEPKWFVMESKSNDMVALEKVVAFTALVMMVFDGERSDCVYKILNKLKGIISTTTQDGYKFQSLDDIKPLLEDKKGVIDFEIDEGDSKIICSNQTTFVQWWDNQLQNGNVITHYRTEGHFMEFTRETAQEVAHMIAHNEFKDILVRGAVGSGKSTGLPSYLSEKGKVLMLESTRPLAENVFKQLKSDPFYKNPTLRMRGTTSYGSTPITIMTSGFALHFYANNPQLLKEFQFIIIDECHVLDANAIAFVSLLKEFAYQGKLVKASATPPGRETEFTTQHKVSLITQDQLSFDQFVAQQGTGSNCDMIDVCDNILVYVASYNEVDQLSKMLLEKGYLVTKVDGRTMKGGKTEIETKGTKAKKHFVVATNIIENGVTLDIEGVVDFGLKVVPELDADSRVMRYSKHRVSFGERIQRIGRVGRHKAGKALKIGTTERNLQKIPELVATEAAFYCFAYGLPVMSEGVSSNMLSKCTVPQAKTMMSFELPIMYTTNLVRFDGSMHPAIHELLKPYKLRDSNIVLNKMAIPHGNVKNWISVRELKYVGVRIDIQEDIRIPFHARDIPDKLHERVYDACLKHKGDAGFGRLSVVNACKVAYTLQTDPTSLQRTIKILDELIAREQRKREYFQSASNTACSGSSYSLTSIINAIKARNTCDFTQENLSVLHSARQQLMEFKNINCDFSRPSTLDEFGALDCLQFESAREISQHLKLKNHWNGSLLAKDMLIALGVLGGGCWMLYTYYNQEVSKEYKFQGKSKRTRQKLKFRAARDMKDRYEVHADEGTLVENFGTRYSKKGKTKGTVVGMGAKTRRFTNMYGFDPTEYSFARYLDPITGATLDETPIHNVNLVVEHFSDIRFDMVDKDLLDRQHFALNRPLECYFVKDAGQKVMRIDLTPHNPLLVSDVSTTIMGYPEREGEFRQTGKARLVDPSELPAQNEEIDVEFESLNRISGLRDYNPISQNVCLLTNESEGHKEKIFGIGYGPVIITNQHLFRRNNGELTIQSKHGFFKCRDTTNLKMLPLEGHDILLIQLPKDFPVFPQKIRFREPRVDDKIVLVSTNFQEKSSSSTVSESSNISRVQSANFYKHWISTIAGHCGNPMVSTKDGFIVGIHSLASLTGDVNIFTSFPSQFENKYLQRLNEHNWCSGWKLNLGKISWGGINIVDDAPEEPFLTSKMASLLSDLNCAFQASAQTKWLLKEVKDNVQAVAQAPSALVTKHVVKGKCALFEVYLANNQEAEKFFRPMMGFYQKSRLNKEAYIKDLMKYSNVIEVGLIDTDKFEKGLSKVESMLRRKGFTNCNYVNDEAEIYAALNMKAAMGALYSGKKKDHFEGMPMEEFAKFIKASCERLFSGKMGVWNGSLKAELRPQEKVLANKTRSFTAAPIDTLLAGKVCVDDFNNKFYSLHLEIPSTVGITKFYGGWNSLLNKLPDGWVYCDADGSQFDSSLTPYLINSVLRLRLNFMEEWDIGEEMLKNLYTEIIYTPILTPDGTIIKKFKGNNSGQPSTVVDNTLMVIMAMYYAAEKLGVEGNLEESVVFYANGDDLLIAVHPSHEWYLDQLATLFKELGLNYDFSSRTRNKGDLWFMSHRGIKRDDLWIPKLEPERIVSILEWDRAAAPEHRLEAICASMIEAWGYDELLNHIRRFYIWVLDQAPYKQLSAEGKAPYISEVALKSLYTGKPATSCELEVYNRIHQEQNNDYDDDQMKFVFQSGKDQLNAGEQQKPKEKDPKQREQEPEASNRQIIPDRDINAGTTGTFSVPRLKKISGKLSLPKIKGKGLLNLDHLLLYVPNQNDISNNIATQEQLEAWHEGVKNAYEVDDQQMEIICNGLMVWCIENGTSGDLQGEWTMMDGDKQVTFPLKPVLDFAKPTLRQIMAHFSQAAESYIEFRNATERYMPRYGLQRNLTDYGLARYAFDFYRLTSKTPTRAREAHMQMKAAAIRGKSNHMFGLDGNVGTDEENTERHTANDVNRNMHHIAGAHF